MSEKWWRVKNNKNKNFLLFVKYSWLFIAKMMERWWTTRQCKQKNSNIYINSCSQNPMKWLISFLSSFFHLNKCTKLSSSYIKIQTIHIPAKITRSFIKTFFVQKLRKFHQLPIFSHHPSKPHSCQRSINWCDISQTWWVYEGKFSRSTVLHGECESFLNDFKWNSLFFCRLRLFWSFLHLQFESFHSFRCSSHPWNTGSEK
jgi:hypothetical protein